MFKSLFKSSGRNKKRFPTAAQGRRRRLRLEPLEQRQVLSGSGLEMNVLGTYETGIFDESAA